MSDLEKNSSDTATTTQTAPSATTSPTGAISNESAPARPTEPSSARQASVQARTGAPQNLSQSSGTPLPRSVPADSGAPETRTAAPKISIRPAAPAQASGKAAVQPAQSRQGPKISVTRHEPGQAPGHKTVQTAARTGRQPGWRTSSGDAGHTLDSDQGRFRSLCQPKACSTGNHPCFQGNGARQRQGAGPCAVRGRSSGHISPCAGRSGTLDCASRGHTGECRNKAPWTGRHGGCHAAQGPRGRPQARWPHVSP